MHIKFQDKIGISLKAATINIVLVANALVWYLCIFNFLKATSIQRGFTGNDLVLIVGVNLLGLILSALLSSRVIQKFQRRLAFLTYWMLAGLALSPLPLLINSTALEGLIATSTVIGIYFGIGLPILMGYFAAATRTENRARLGGIIILINGIGFPLLSLLATTDALLTTTALAIWRLAGLIILLLLKPQEQVISKQSTPSFQAIISNRSFYLYFFPWLAFSLVNDLSFPVLHNFFQSDFLAVSSTVDTALAGIFALFVGFFADYVGRKRLILFGFALLGLGYAALGLFPGNSFSWWFYICADGIAWGSFTALFLMTLWGDLASGQNGEKYYILGFLPYLISNFTRVSMGEYVASKVTNEVAVFSFASFFLFAAVLPIFLAPETLPEKAMKERDLKNYLDKAQKIAEKENKKQKKSSKGKRQKSEPIQEKSPEEYEEARKLAEKYY
jgi:MFS family permease